MRVPRLVLGMVAVLAFGSGPLWAGPKIGLLLKGRTPFWMAVQKGAQAAADKAGAELIIKAPPTESDIAVQIALLRALANQGVQAIVIAPGSADSLADPVAAVAANGIKVVVIDSPLSGPAGGIFVGTNQRAAGEAAGTLLASLVTGSQEVALLRHTQTGGATLLREAGAIDALHTHNPQLTVHVDIYAGAAAGEAENRGEYLLTAYPNVQGIFASGTPGTMAMIQVLNDKKLGGHIRLVGSGFNLNPEVVADLESGVLSGWVAQLPGEIGGQGVARALELVAGQTVPAKTDIHFIVVTKQNLGEPEVKALLGQ